MVKQQPANLSRQLVDIQQTVARLQDTVQLMNEHRQRVIDQRRRRMAIIGGASSLLLHLLLMIYLGLVYRGGGGGGEVGGGMVQLPILSQEELDDYEESSFDELETEAASMGEAEIPSESLPAASAASASSAAAGLGASAGAVPTLGGSGGGGSGGGEMGLGGGGGAGGTSFFGIGSKGTRFAFIIDISGSMSEAGKLDVAKRELLNAVTGLPDYAFFYVLLFNSDFIQPPSQKGWTRARKNLVKQFASWLKEVYPDGGTAPRSSFMQIFSLEARPDVIYFLTDGQFQDITAEEVATLNKAGKRAVINTIQFGDRGGEELLRQIARASGGVYRFVPVVEGF